MFKRFGITVLALFAFAAHANLAPSECLLDLRKGVDPDNQKFLECQTTCHFMKGEVTAGKITPEQIVENQTCIVLDDLRQAVRDGDPSNQCQWLFDKISAPLNTEEESFAYKECLVNGFTPKEKPRTSGSIFSQRIPFSW